MRLPLIVFAFTACLQAQDQQLAVLRATVLTLRQQNTDYSTTPANGLTKAKRQLQGWVESNLAQFPERGDEEVLSKRMNAALQAANLFCRYQFDKDDQISDLCDQTLQGYVGKIQLRRESGFLILTTGVGIIECRYDESAYAYGWTNSRWERVWQDEQDAAKGKAYEPQYIQEVKISPPGPDQTRLALVLGTNAGCASVLRPVYFRILRFGGKLSSFKLLLSRSEPADIGYPMHGRVTPAEVLIEFTSVNFRVNAAFRSTSIRHYSVRGDTLQRIDPVALTPIGFLNLWLDEPWSRSAVRSESTSLQRWHNAIKGGDAESTKQCKADPGLWQVVMDANLQNDQSQLVYFLVRWKQPFRFTVFGIQETDRPDCTIEDDRTEEPQSLFIKGR